MQDLREFLRGVDSIGELKTVRHADWNLEIGAITGGTGRFEGATGSFDAERVVDMAHGTVTESFDGTISTPR